ncbi:MAG: hypothetical protein OEW12_08565, partial [Deltaproteobacteria bacterium]|nr:hypothetical protein [Deltaproteobacteria bacterium]
MQQTPSVPVQARSAPAQFLKTAKTLAGLLFKGLLTPFYTLYEARLAAQAHTWKIPHHIGIIMDGNRRYAKAQK